jgi:hypothetical protein
MEANDSLIFADNTDSNNTKRDTVQGLLDLATGAPSFRNLIINGDMAVAQRGASFAAVTNTAYMLDRYTYVQGGTTGVITVTQDTDVPNEEFDFSLKVDVTTADAAVAAGDVAAISQYVEAFNTSALQLGTATAATFTLSFWVKSPKTGAHYVTIQNNASDRSYPALYTVSVADTWEKKTITITGDTTGTWVRGTNGIGIKVHFTLICGTNYHGTADTWNAGTDWAASGVVNCFDNTANNFYITGVQLEVGSSATDFEHVPYDYQLRRCERYTRVISSTFGAANTTTVMLWWIDHPGMRAVPSLSTTAALGVRAGSGAAITQASAGVGYIDGDANGTRCNGGNFTGIVADTFYALTPTGGDIIVDSEL